MTPAGGETAFKAPCALAVADEARRAAHHPQDPLLQQHIGEPFANLVFTAIQARAHGTALVVAPSAMLRGDGNGDGSSL